MKNAILMMAMIILCTTTVISQTQTVQSKDSIFIKSLSDSNWRAYEPSEIPCVIRQGKVSIGFIFAPQGVLCLNDLPSLFSSKSPLLAFISFSKKNDAVKFVYNLTYNKIQALYFHSFTTDIGAYVLLNKNVLIEGGYTGAGVTRGIWDGKVSLFCEVGTTWNKWSPTFCTGVLIPFSIGIK